MENSNIVHCPPETKHFLTVETREGGVVRSVLANIDGSPIQDSGIKYAGDDPAHVAIYLDTISGEHVASVTPAAAALILKNGGKLFHGVGGVGGYFIEAPDFTLNGRFGERSKPAKKNTEPTEYGGPKPAAPAPAPATAHQSQPAPTSKFVNPTKPKKRKARRN